MGLLVMILGLVLFLGIHTFTTQRDLRARVVASMGEGGYKIGYTVVSVAGLALVTWGFAHYRANGWIDVWNPPTAFKHITVALMLPAVILLSSLVGAAVGILLIWLAKHGRHVPIPFGPYLAAAGIIALFWGDAINRAYLQHF